MEAVAPEIFNTPLVRADIDSLWDEQNYPPLNQCDTLVISRPYASGSDAEQQLQRMLGACKLDASAYQILFVNETASFAWHKLKSLSGATKVLLLGVQPSQLGITAMMMLHAVNHFNGAVWMATSSLEEIAANAQLKQHLWVNVLKPVYLPS
ncbi:hypothetical protein [Rurimicrobium arvi]|uniref:Uncharacterized protein n=1 Tax=Rurimicrobium arvi TaxID=2049916 RepID=A0ABP8MUU1_9BACT